MLAVSDAWWVFNQSFLLGVYQLVKLKDLIKYNVCLKCVFFLLLFLLLDG